MILETKRLLLREMIPDDFQALLRVLGDPETMWHYPYTFDGQHVRDWIARNMNRYQKDGLGLWAVCLKDNVPSFRTAESIGMRFACEYPDEINEKTHVSVITREEWLNELTENINWGHCGISLGDGRIIHAWDTVRIDDYREIEAMTALSGDRPGYIGWVPIESVLYWNKISIQEIGQ